MGNFTKYLAVGIAGYLIGFYEWKSKTLGVMLKCMNDKEKTKEE